MLIWIAVANAVLWSGVILFLLLYLIRDSQELEAELAQMEAQVERER